MKYVLYNPLANNKRGLQNATAIMHLDGDYEYVFKDVTAMSDINAFIDSISPEDDVIVAGGDGTLNRFVNAIGDRELKNDVYYFPAGSGNDFMRDICKNSDEKITKINKYIADLPIVEINGKRSYFFNGIGFGIDGYCCEEGDKIQAKSDKPVNYTAIALKGFLFKFSSRNATVTVDGEAREYKNVWLAPAMNGRYFGGGMQITPMQDRLNESRTVTSLVMSHKNRLRILLAFPSVFKGEHIAKFPKLLDVRPGNEITVEFDKPTALQIDGETVKNVLKYTVYSGEAKKKLLQAAETQEALA